MEELSINYSFKDKDLEYLEELAVILNTIIGALGFLWDENQCYFGQLLLTLYLLKIRLETLKKNISLFSQYDDTIS
jgi:hypothetical protein